MKANRKHNNSEGRIQYLTLAASEAEIIEMVSGTISPTALRALKKKVYQSRKPKE